MAVETTTVGRTLPRHPSVLPAIQVVGIFPTLPVKQPCHGMSLLSQEFLPLTTQACSPRKQAPRMHTGPGSEISFRALALEIYSYFSPVHLSSIHYPLYNHVLFLFNCSAVFFLCIIHMFHFLGHPSLGLVLSILSISFPAFLYSLARPWFIAFLFSVQYQHSTWLNNGAEPRDFNRGRLNREFEEVNAILIPISLPAVWCYLIFGSECFWGWPDGWIDPDLYESQD